MPDRIDWEEELERLDRLVHCRAVTHPSHGDAIRQYEREIVMLKRKILSRLASSEASSE